MLFKPDAICCALFCRELAGGENETLPSAALGAILVTDGPAAANARGWGASLRPDTLCLYTGEFQLAPAAHSHTVCVGFEGAAARAAAVNLTAPLTVNAAGCPQAVQALTKLAETMRTGHAGPVFCYNVLCALNKANEAPAETTSAQSRLVADAVLSIRRHYSELYGVEELSAQLGVSKSHLVRAFSAEMGMGPGHYLTQVRLEVAMLLLAQRAYPLELIASLCGFSCANYLCRVFRRATGLTPSAWRMQNKGTYGTAEAADALERRLFV